MSSTTIVPKLLKNKNEMKETEVENVEEEQASVLEQQKVDEVEEYQTSFHSRKQKNG